MSTSCHSIVRIQRLQLIVMPRLNSCDRNASYRGVGLRLAENFKQVAEHIAEMERPTMCLWRRSLQRTRRNMPPSAML